MKMLRMRRSMLTIAVISMVLTSFYFGSIPLASAEPKSVMKLAIHWSMRADFNDPSMGGVFSLFNLYFFHDSLLKPMTDGWYSPCLAESWKVSPDYRVYEFKLRKGVKFHNGDEMTAEDVVFTFERYKGGKAEFIKSRIEKLEAVNPYLFRVTFKKPFVDFLDFFLPGEVTIGFVVPKKYIEKVGDEAYRKNPIGCGPYKFVEFKPGIILVGEAFKDFWRKEPNIKRLEFHIVSEASTRYAMVKKGEVDFASLMADVLYEKVKSDPALRAAAPLSPNKFIIPIAAQFDPKSPWSDSRVRKAASLALDRKSLVDIHAPGGAPIGNLGLEGDVDNVPFPPDPYDPEQAKKLMAEAGYAKGFQGGKFYPLDGYWAMGEQIVNYWKAIGINMETVLYDRPTWSSRLQGGGFKGGLWIDPINPTTMGFRLAYFFGYGNLYGKYDDIQVLWNKYQESYDPKERKTLITRVQNMYHDRTMFIPLVAVSSPSAIGPRPKGSLWRIKPHLMWWVSPMEELELNSYD